MLIHFLTLQASECVVFEDSLQGCQAATAAGVGVMSVVRLLLIQTVARIFHYTQHNHHCV